MDYDYAMKSRYIISKNMVSAIQTDRMLDLKGLLELLNTSNDFNLQIKLFSTLSAYLMSKEGNIEAIITYNTLYDKMCNVLSNCPPRKATVMFNFLSAFMYATDNVDCRRKGLQVYAKNMIRSSGCLATLCELFTSCMMHQDSWRSLCRCLAETCSGLETNQSYCTHLVPVCVQKCSQRNLEVFLVLQTLLQNHTKNIHLFLECSGLSLFQREFLKHDACLQLLSSLVQISPDVPQRINETDVSENLRHFLHLYGPQSRLGQWATIILYHISGPKGTFEVPVVENKQDDETNNTLNPENIDPHCSTDTTHFFQNVRKEIMQCGPPRDLKSFQGLFIELQNRQKNNNLQFLNQVNNNKILMSQQNITMKNTFSRPRNNIMPKNEGSRNFQAKDLSFSFLQNQNYKRHSNMDTVDELPERLQRTITITNNVIKQPSGLYQSLMRQNTSQYSTPELSHFEPKFVSTPKKRDTVDFSTPERQQELPSVRTSTPKRHQHQNNIRNNMTNYIRQRQKRRMQKRKVTSRAVRVSEGLHQSTIDKDIKHRSLSGWLFETINESCTTLVKTVKHIFKPKTCLEDTNAKSLSSTEKDPSCSYSFTNYMRKRDAILKNERSKTNVEYELSMEMSNSCNSCNDTMVLKNKLANDDYLKQTVRKLKVGINLYGCDFKKISKQLWPQQTYMTPVVLYNLYRKLLIK